MRRYNKINQPQKVLHKIYNTRSRSLLNKMLKYNLNKSKIELWK